jgi:hypothetical protein
MIGGLELGAGCGSMTAPPTKKMKMRAAGAIATLTTFLMAASLVRDDRLSSARRTSCQRNVEIVRTPSDPSKPVDVASSFPSSEPCLQQSFD